MITVFAKVQYSRHLRKMQHMSNRIGSAGEVVVEGRRRGKRGKRGKGEEGDNSWIIVA